MGQYYEEIFPTLPFLFFVSLAKVEVNYDVCMYRFQSVFLDPLLFSPLVLRRKTNKDP